MAAMNQPRQMSVFDIDGNTSLSGLDVSENTLMQNSRRAIIGVRKGIVDLWNAFMVYGAEFAPGTDIPICPTTASSQPEELISWREAKKLHKREIGRGHKDYRVNAYIHFYIDDQYFDGLFTGIWFHSKRALKVISHFVGIIAPDFSTYADFPDPLVRWNFYRMNAFGYWVGHLGIPVIVNARWGWPETWGYCWDGIHPGDMVAIGTVGSGLKKKINQDQFKQGFDELIRRIHPPVIVVYGSATHPCFDKARAAGIQIVAFPSETSERFARRCRHE